MDCHPLVRFLKVEKDVRKDEIVGEVRGKVGHFRDYCLDPNSRWQELRHPEPFVFFHPQLPIYIDSRKEGTLLRYIRRSCRPNVTLKTFITNEIEYHFCFVANQDISSDSEITTTWYLDPQLFPTSNGFVKQENPNEGIPDAAAIAISNVLAHFGGCACDSSQQCLLANVDRRCRPRPPESTAKQANGRRKKTKTKSTVSPASTGRATNSRAGSEIRKHGEDEDQSRQRSTSASVRDQPQSRDLSPANHATDIFGANGTELSAREKRKIAAAEKKFEQLEQDQQHAQKKRRRNNAGNSISVGLTPASCGNGDFVPNYLQKSSGTKPPRLDTIPAHRSPGTSIKASPGSATSHRESRSTPKTSAASTPRIGSPLTRVHYVDSCIQTDSDEVYPHLVSQKSSPRPDFVPLTRRLFSRYHHDRLHLDESNRSQCVPTKQQIASASQLTRIKSPLSQDLKDVEMKDAHTSITPQKSMHPPSQSPGPPAGELSDSMAKPPPFPLPSTAAHNILVCHIPNDQGAKLRVKPPQMQLSTPPVSSSTDTPSSTQSSHFRSPLSAKAFPNALAPGLGITAPSPVKKRMSLGDYMSRRGNLTTPTTEKVHTQIVGGYQQVVSSTHLPDGTNPMETEQTPTKVMRLAEEAADRERDLMSDVVMKDAPPLYSHNDSPSNSSFPRDPRIHPST
ncbi:predicted protein [Uncinocarpus reesii 1704]|uniref:SET domain-containing protein n=1 Tax=Uncinocarpus reesii (strain UAMH 1704) TaxID=336963 RepID=C4JEU6_UNCRE|nr:uncharacterized protein UREG_02256 [Uncinocarpus reesii 1704]EEP77407.1 predicted protein [Uncinocarpus reesii 1704]